MEEDRDDLDNLFDEYESNDPQPQEDATNENEAADPEKVPVPKRVVKRPRLKFNPERLCGKKGIPILVDHFKDVKFKGKGYEKEDLSKLLTTLELWTHRLFPSMKFEDCLRQIEHLGKKRPVKTCVQKIRLDFPILENDFVRNEDEEEEQEQPNEIEPEPPTDAFDRLFDDYQGHIQPVLASTPSSLQTVGNILGTSFGASISEEQKERMEYNKRLAIERRKARMSGMQSSSIVNSTESSSNGELVPISPSSERTLNNDSNSLFDDIQQQHTNTEFSNVDEQTKKKYTQSMELKDGEKAEMDELMDLVDEDDKKEANHDVVPHARNDFAEGNDKEELELDELMDLVDEGDKNELDHDTVLSVKNDKGKYCQSVDIKGSKEMELVDIDKSCHDALSNFDNNAELGLEELIDLVDEGDKDETNNPEMPSVKNDEGKCKQIKDGKESKEEESVDKGGTHKISCSTLSIVQNYASSKIDSNEESRLEKLVDEAHPYET